MLAVFSALSLSKNRFTSLHCQDGLQGSLTLLYSLEPPVLRLYSTEYRVQHNITVVTTQTIKDMSLLETFAAMLILTISIPNLALNFVELGVS